MRALTALTLYVCLTSAGFGQQTGQPPHGEDREQQIEKYLQQGDYSNAEHVFREALVAPEYSERALLTLRNGLADLLREEGREGEARELFNRVLNSPDITWKQRLAATMGLADMEGHATSPEAAAELWMKALAITREYGDKISEASALRGLANTWFEAHDASKAEPLLRHSLQILDNDPAAPAWQTASTLGSLGHVYRAADKLTLAENAWTRALELDRTTFGENHPQTAYMMERLAELYAVRKEFTLARQYSGRALDAMRASCGAESLAVAGALASRGSVEEYAKSLPSAMDDYAAALRIARKHPDSPSFEIAIMRHYAALLKATHRDREAKALAVEAGSFQQQSLR